MELKPEQWEILEALFHQSHATRPTRPEILAWLKRRTRAEVEDVLSELDGLALVDAERAKLTMAGLAYVVSHLHRRDGAVATRVTPPLARVA